MNSQKFLTDLGLLSAQAGAVVLLILAAQWTFRRQLAPRWRCALWLVLVVRLLVPFSTSSAISIFNLLAVAETKAAAAVGHANVTRVTGPAEQAPGARFAPLASSPADQPSSTLAPSSAGRGEGTSLRPGQTWPRVLLGIWLAGVTVLLVRLLMMSRRFARRLAGASPVTDAQVLSLLTICRARLQIASRLSIVETEAVASPALYGFLRPQLLVPRGFCQRLSRSELQFVLLHELAHLQRRDLPASWLMAVLQIAHWFNPLVWLGFARWRSDRELACDALALEAAGPDQIKPYGETILRLLEGISSPILTPGLAGILEDPSQLRHRIRMIADFRPKSRWSALGFLLVAAVAASSLTDARSQENRAPGQSSDSARAVTESLPHVYRLVASDMVHLSFYREESLNVTQRIDGAGNLSLALVGDIHVAGLSLSEARKAVEDAYRKVGISQDHPVGVSMTIEQYTPRRVSIQGAVKNPGVYELPIETTLSVVTLVMKAGGFTDVGKGTDVRLVHRGRSKAVQVIDVQGIIQGRSPISADDPSLALEPGDIVFVSEKQI